MTDKRQYIDGWLASAKDVASSNQWTEHQKDCLLAYDAGRCWGFAFDADDAEVMRHGFDAHEQIMRMRDGLRGVR